MRRVPLDTDDRGGSLSGERSGQEVDRNQNQNQNQNQSQVDCLTVEEEQKLVNFYCVKAMDFADFCDFPTNVKVDTKKAARLASTIHLVLSIDA